MSISNFRFQILWLLLLLLIGTAAGQAPLQSALLVDMNQLSPTYGKVLKPSLAQFKAINGLTGVADGDKGDITVSASGATFTIDAGVITLAKISAALKPSGTALTTDESLRALGTTASTAAAGNDTRLSDARTPTDGSVTTVKVAAATLVTAAETIAANNNDTTLPTSAAVASGLALKLDASTATNPQTGNYPLALADANKLITVNSASAAAITVPLNSSVAIPIGSRIFIRQDGAGAVSVAATGGVTITQRSGTLVIGAAGHYAALYKTATDTWELSVDMLDGAGSSDPTTGTDAALGYQVGSLWRNTTSGVMFLCRDNTASAAAWYGLASTTYTDAKISDTAYSSGFNGVTGIGASKNALYDQLHIGDIDDDGKIDVLDSGAGLVVTNSAGTVGTSRTIVDGSSAAYLAVTNGDGQSGNPSIDATNRVKRGVDYVTFLLTIDAVADSMDYTLGYVSQAFAITELRFVHNGTLSSPSITPTVKYGTDRSSGTSVVTSPSAVTSSTTGASVTSFNNSTPAANSWIWLTTSGKSGTTDKFTVVVVGHY